MFSLPKNKWVTATSLLSIAVGVVVLVGWLFDLPGIQKLFPHFVSMMFNTALCFTLLGTALLITQFQIKKYSRTAYFALALLVTLIACLSLSQDIFRYSAGIDQLVVIDRADILDHYAYPGRMAVNVSTCFILFGLALIGFRSKRRVINVVSQYLLHCITLISGIIIVAYLYGMLLFYNTNYVGAMAIHTAVLFFLLSLTASLLQPSLGITNLFTGQLVGNKTARRLFLMMIVIVMIFGELRILSLRYHLFDPQTGVLIVAVSFLLVSLALIWYTANWLNRIDTKRYEAEEEIKVMNEELEQRVDERSAELLSLLEKFKESETLFRTAFEFSAIGIAFVSLDGKWLKVNRGFCDMVEYSPGELLSRHVTEITHPDDLKFSLDMIKKGRIEKRDTYHMEKRYVSKSGAVIWASVNMAPIFDDDGKPMYMVSQIEDITESKNLNARFRSIVESDFVAIKLNDANGNIIYRSPSMQAINGWTDDEMNREYFKLTHPDDLEMIKNLHQEVLANPGKSVNVTYRILHKNGYYIWIESLLCNKLADPELGAIITVTRDVTERKLVEDRLKKSEEKYHSLIEHASDAIYLLDFAGNLTDVNASMCKMTGYSRDELLQMNIEQLVDPEQLKTDPLPRGPRNPDEAIIRERRLIRKNREVFDIEVNVKVIGGERTLVIARDITDRKRMERELRDAELKFRILAEKSMVGVYISQRERLVYANPRFAEIFGYELSELLNTPKSIVDIVIADDDRKIVRDYVQARYNAKIDNAHYQVRGKNKDGSLNHIEFFGSRVIIDGEPSIIGTMLDITERKRAEELIIHEKTLSETIINSLPEVFYVRNQKGEFLRWNKNFETVTGYSAAEIKQLQSINMIAEEDRDTVRNEIAKLTEKKYTTIEAGVINKNGNKMPFLLTITSMIYENQPCFLGIAIDISARKKAEEELRSSEHKYKLLFESNPLPMWMIAKDDLSIIAVNNATSNLYGYSKEELLTMHATDFRLPEDMDEQMEDWYREVSTLEDQRIIRHLKKDGTLMFIQIIAYDIMFEGRSIRLSFTNDITEKVKAEETLKKSEANLKTIMNTTDTAYVLLDKKLDVMTSNQMAVKYANSQFRNTPVKGDVLSDYFPPEQYSQFLNYTGEVLAGKNISYEISYPYPDGSALWYSVKLFPITNDKNEIFGLMLALSDITERKNAEESLKSAYQQIQDHINSIKDMAWKQSHLMRSPVANLKGLATLLREEPSDSELIKFIHIELNRLDKVIIEMADDASNHD